MKSLAKVVNLSKQEFPIKTNLSDLLGFNTSPYHKSFISLVRRKDYIYMVTNNDKVSYKSSYIIHIS